jgi:DNA-binding CsgD family transcriptional regulator
LSRSITARTLRAMRSSWRIRNGRDALAFALATATVGAASLIFVAPRVPDDTVEALASWRFAAATAALLIVVAFALRRRSGLAYATLVVATASVADAIGNAANAARSFGELGDAVGQHDPGAGLILLASLARTGIPAAMLALYATAPERRLARWVPAAAWAIAVATIAVAVLRVALSLDPATADAAWADAPILAYQLDEPIAVLIVAALGILGSLRAAGRAYVPAQPEHVPTPGIRAVSAPSRPLLAAVAAAAVLWLPATIAFINRSTVLDGGDEIRRVFLVPIAAALIGIVTERWSRLVAWLAVSVAFETIAFLAFYRGAADYVAYALTLPTDTEIPLTLSFVTLGAASALIVLFGCAAVSLALREAVREPTTAPSQPAPGAGRLDESSADRRWAMGGALVGLALFGWLLVQAWLGSGLSAILMAGLVPIYAIPLVIGLGLCRRLVPAVAEAESVATRPFRPLHYLETFVAEAVTRRAEHGRRAAFAERVRLASELDASLLPDLERLRSTTVAGAPRTEVAERLRDLQGAVRRLLTDGQQVAFEPAFPDGGSRPMPAAADPDLRLPTRREVEVVRLVAAGRTNDEIARELALSLKTVESHLRRLFDRYGVANRTELAVLAIREGWVDES